MKNGQSLMQAYIQAPWRRQLQFVGLFLVILVMLGLLASIYLSVSATAAAYGRQIQKAQDDILNFHHSIANLEAQLAELHAASNLREYVEEAGLHQAGPSEIVYLPVSGYNGDQPVRLAPPPGPAVASRPGVAPEFSQSLLDWLIEKMDEMELSFNDTQGGQP